MEVSSRLGNLQPSKHGDRGKDPNDPDEWQEAGSPSRCSIVLEHGVSFTHVAAVTLAMRLRPRSAGATSSSLGMSAHLALAEYHTPVAPRLDPARGSGVGAVVSYGVARPLNPGQKVEAMPPVVTSTEGGPTAGMC